MHQLEIGRRARLENGRRGRQTDVARLARFVRRARRRGKIYRHEERRFSGNYRRRPTHLLTKERRFPNRRRRSQTAFFLFVDVSTAKGIALVPADARTLASSGRNFSRRNDLHALICSRDYAA